MRASLTPVPGWRVDAAATVIAPVLEARCVAMSPWRGSGHTVVSVSLDIPGAPAIPCGASALFRWATGALHRALPAATPVYETSDALGPFQVWTTPGAALAVKRRCLQVEGAAPAARLLDLDVFDPNGHEVGRAALLLPPRKCLACDGPAVECLRLGRHAPEALLAKACELLGPFRS